MLKVIDMIEAGRPCLDLAQQLHAVESAIHAAKKTLIHDHLDHRLDAAVISSGMSARPDRPVQFDHPVPVGPGKPAGPVEYSAD